MRRRAALAALAALGWLPIADARAQPVQVFDDVPPIEMLRRIVVPESAPGASRRIVVPRSARPATAATAESSASDPILTVSTLSEGGGASFTASQTAEPQSAEPQLATSDTEAVTDTETAAPTPAPAPAPAAVGVRIGFAFDSDALPASARPGLDRIAQLLQEQPGIRLGIEGHTDARGSDSYNQRLSERRARSVARYLTQIAGIDAERLDVVGKGRTEPVEADPYDPRNRRVQFVRIN